MTVPWTHMYRLSARGGPGLACDKDGIALGAASLVHARLGTGGARRCDVRSTGAIRRVLATAYGPQPDEVVQRLHRGLRRAAASIESGDLALAGIEAVMLGLPDVTPEAMSKLAEIADLEKGGAAWEDEDRVPAGRPNGGEWTSGDDGADWITDANDPRLATVKPATPALRLDDGVYRPGLDHPFVTLVGGPEDDDERARIGSNGPPDEFTMMREAFSGLKHLPGAALLAPLSHLFDLSAPGDEANLAVAEGQYQHLRAEIKSVDPKFKDQEFWPGDGIGSLDWDGRNQLINDLRMKRAAAFYRVRGDTKYLTEETVRFLQEAVDKAYADAVEDYTSGKIKGRLSREEAIGNAMDKEVREKLRRFYNEYGIPYGRHRDITINNWDPSAPESGSSRRIPDARIGRTSIDWTIADKTIATRQVREFFQTVSKPDEVIIIRPSQLSGGGVRFIPRPDYLKRRWFMYADKKITFIPRDIYELRDMVGSTMIRAGPTRGKKSREETQDDINLVFHRFEKGMEIIRSEIGEAHYLQLNQMGAQVRAYFEADLDDTNGESRKAYPILHDMEDILTACANNCEGGC
jgi:hypothetical protein